jgi:hypothetical protein
MATLPSPQRKTMTPSDNPQNNQPNQSNNANKIWLWVGLGCGGLLLLLGLIVGGFMFWAWRTLNFSMSPEQAEETAQGIMDYEIPGGSRGLISMNFQGVEFAGVMSAEDPESVVLIVGRLSPEAQGGDTAEEVEAALEEGLAQQQPDVNVQSTRTEERSLCGTTASVSISEGEQESFGQPNEPALVYQTNFNYNDFLYFVSLTTTGENAESLAEEVFSSLDCQ